MIDPFAREVRIASSNYAAYVAATTEASATDSRAIAYARGHIDRLRLVYIAAACAMEIDRNIAARHDAHMATMDHRDAEYAGFEYMRDKRVGRALANGATATATLQTLAELGCVAARSSV